MGLSQYIYVTEKTKLKDNGTDLADYDAIRDDKEFFEWRKHWDLHGFLEQVYLEKGGKEPATWDVVQLTEKDIDDLKYALDKNELPWNKKCFFWDDSPEFKQEQTNEFVDKAKLFYAAQAMKSDDKQKTLFYWASI